METRTIVLNKARNVTLTAYLQPVDGSFEYLGRRPAVLVLPGGGYQHCSEREADPVALAYLKAGCQAFILRYSVGPDSTWPNPLDDCDQALALIRKNADEWGLWPDKVAVVGFSAGGHLAAASATMGAERPDAAILGYAVAGSDVRSCNLSAPDCIAAVDGHTCPCFVFAARDDGLVPVMNSLRFAEALAEHDVSFETHIYSYGGHGFSTAEACAQNPTKARSPRVAEWVEASIGWLGEVFGTFDGEGGLTEPVVGGHVNGNYDPCLSTECTIKKLMDVPESREIVEPLFDSVRVDSSSEGELTAEERQATIDSVQFMKLSDALAYAGVSEKDMAELDGKLRAIRNPDA